MSFTGRYAKTGVSPTSIVSSSLSTSRVREEVDSSFSSVFSMALVLPLPAFTRSVANVPNDTTSASIASGIDTFFFVFYSRYNIS